MVVTLLVVCPDATILILMIDCWCPSLLNVTWHAFASFSLSIINLCCPSHFYLFFDGKFFYGVRNYFQSKSKLNYFIYFLYQVHYKNNKISLKNLISFTNTILIQLLKPLLWLLILQTKKFIINRYVSISIYHGLQIFITNHYHELTGCIIIITNGK